MLIVYSGGFIFLQSSDKTHLPPESSPLPSEFPPSYTSLEENAKKERGRLEELIRAKGMKYGSYPRFAVALKGQKVSIMNPSRMVLRLCWIYREVEGFCSLLRLKLRLY